MSQDLPELTLLVRVAGYQRSITTDRPAEAAAWLLRNLLPDGFANFNPGGVTELFAHFSFGPDLSAAEYHRLLNRAIGAWRDAL